MGFAAAADGNRVVHRRPAGPRSVGRGAVGPLFPGPGFGTADLTTTVRTATGAAMPMSFQARNGVPPRARRLLGTASRAR